MKLNKIIGKTASKLSLSGNILTVDSVDYDLDNLNQIPSVILDDEGNCTNDEEIESFTESVYIAKDGETKVLKIAVDTDRQFLLINGNASKFYDWNDDGTIDEETELPDFVEIWNQTEEERRAVRKAKLEA